MISCFWQLIMMSEGMLTFGEMLPGHFTFGIVFAALFVLVPFMVVIGLFMSSAVWYLFLQITRGADNGV